MSRNLLIPSGAPQDKERCTAPTVKSLHTGDIKAKGSRVNTGLKLRTDTDMKTDGARRQLDRLPLRVSLQDRGNASVVAKLRGGSLAKSKV